MTEDTAELGEWEKNLLNWENERKNCWTRRMIEETAELGEWQKKRLNWENDRIKDWTGRMTEGKAELGKCQKKRLNWGNEKRDCWTGRMREEMAELGERKKKWLHTNLRPAVEGWSIKKRTSIYITYINQTYYSNSRASRRISLSAKRSFRNPRPLQFRLHPSFCKLPVIATWKPNKLSQRLNKGHIRRIYTALFCGNSIFVQTNLEMCEDYFLVIL
jgi:hypothetical protein